MLEMLTSADGIATAIAGLLLVGALAIGAVGRLIKEALKYEDQSDN